MIAKQNGIIKLRGTIDGVTFGQNRYGYYAGPKRNIDKTRIKNDPAFQRTRENMDEFGMLATAGKYLRHPLKILTSFAGDAELNQRVMTLMADIRDMDFTSKRGSRNVATALAEDPAVANLFKGFEFNDRSHLPNVLIHPFLMDTATGTITLEDLDVKHEVKFPPAATHVHLLSAWLNVDFESGDYERSISAPLVLGRNAPVPTGILAPTLPPSGNGTTLFLLRVGFSQLMNGIHYHFKNGEYNVVCVVGVGG